jgi:hypothetical protein
MRTPFDLQKHILSSYSTLRRGIGLQAAALPLVLSVLGILLASVALQESISAYYHAGGGAMRNWFVEILWAIGVFLLLYRKTYRFLGHAMRVFPAIVGVFFSFLAPTPWGPTQSSSLRRLRSGCSLPTG